MNLSNLLFAFSYVSVGSVLIPIVFYFFAKRKSRALHILSVLLLASFASDLINRICVLYGVRGYSIVNLFFVVQFILLSLIYTSLLTKNKVVYFFLVLVSMAFLVNCTFFQSINEYQTTIISLESILLVTFSIKYFIEMYHALPTKNLMTYFPMWINLAVFLYFAFSLFLFAIASYIFKNTSREIGMTFWGLHNFNNIVKNLMFAAGIYMCLIREQGHSKGLDVLD